MSMMKRGNRGMLIGFIALAMLIVSACHKNDNSSVDNRPYTLDGNATGSQVVPPVPDSGYATITGTYNPATHVINYTSNWTNLSGSPLTAGIYVGAPGAGGVAVGDAWSVSGGSTGTVTGTMNITDAQAEELLKGNMYYTYGTANHPSGEVRGQITAVR
jgi:CHRD domain